MDYPMGTISGQQALAIRTTDIIVHAWDLARAIGAPDTLDAGLVAWADDNIERTYAGLPEMPTSLQTTHRFFAAPGPEAAASTCRQDRLLHRTGRSKLANPTGKLSNRPGLTSNFP